VAPVTASLPSPTAVSIFWNGTALAAADADAASGALARSQPVMATVRPNTQVNSRRFKIILRVK
jgi:hypothetical protein